MACLVPKCSGCPFKSIHTVGSKGPKNSPFVIIGESPGKEEMKQGAPFVGKSGTVLDEALSRLPHPEPYVTNAFKCMPIIAKGNKKEEEDTKRAVLACASNLREELAQLEQKPRIILATGAAALWATTGNTSLKITKERGRLFQSPYAEIGVVATVHPAYLLRGFGSWRQFLADVNLAMRLVNGQPYIQPGTAEVLIVEPGDIEWLAEKYADSPIIGADIETGDLSPWKDGILSIGFTDDGKTVYIVPEELVPQTGVIFRKAKGRFVWHNGKFDTKFMHVHNIPEARVDEDTLLQSYALDERRGIHDLEQVSKDWLNAPSWKGMLDAYLPKKNSSYRLVPKHILYKYQGYDIADTFALHHVLRPQVAAQPLAELLYTKTLIPASGLLERIERNGMLIDLDTVAENGKYYDAEIKKYADQLNKISIDQTGAPINPNSPVQLVKLLFDDFGIKTKFRSTDEHVLKELPAHPAVVALRNYRKPAKAKSTYVTPYQPRVPVKLKKTGEVVMIDNPDWIIQSDGKVHSTYLLHGTPTGRLASRDPNLQNITRGPTIRNQFVAGEGRILIEVDLNQAELRSLAALSQDPFLCHIYETEGMSLHEVQRNAAYGDPKEWSALDIERYLAMFHLTHEDRFTAQGKDRIIEEQKMRAKAVNFGIVYGRTAPSLAEEFHTSIAEAQRWIEAWFGRFPKAREFIEVCRRAPEKGKDLVTIFGRRKRHGVVSDPILISLQNEAANMPHQSIASDINLQGAIEYEEEILDLDGHILNLVHDSSIMDVPDDPRIIAQVIRVTTTTLAAVPPKWGLTRIPFKADAKIGKRWGSLDEKAANKILESV